MTIYTIIILMLLQLITTFEMMVIMPLAPIIAENYQIVSASVTLLSLGYATSGLLTPFFGYLADRYSMKHMILVSMSLFGMGCYIVSLNSIATFVVGRFILGIGYFNLTSIIMSYTALLVPEHRLGFVSGLYKIAFALGAFLSPTLSGILIEFMHFTQIYFFLMWISFGATLLLIFIPNLKATKHGEHLDLKSVISIFRDKKSVLMIMSVFLISLPSIYFYNYISIHLTEIGISQSVISNYYGVIAAGSILAGIVISLLSDKVGKERMTIVFTISAALALFGIMRNPVGLLIGFFFGVSYDVIWGLLFPISSGYHPAKSATFLTILSFTMSFTNIVTNMSGPVLYRIGGMDLLLLICSSALFVSVILLFNSFKSYNINQRRAYDVNQEKA